MNAGSQAGTREAQKAKRIEKSSPFWIVFFVHVAYFVECDFSCILWCPIFGHFVAIWCPKVPKLEVLGNHFNDILG